MHACAGRQAHTTLTGRPRLLPRRPAWPPRLDPRLEADIDQLSLSPSPSPSPPGLRRRTFTSTSSASSTKSRSSSVRRSARANRAQPCSALGGRRSAKLTALLRLRRARGAAASERRARESETLPSPSLPRSSQCVRAPHSARARRLAPGSHRVTSTRIEARGRILYRARAPASPTGRESGRGADG